jgi:hypothetical protein
LPFEIEGTLTVHELHGDHFSILTDDEPLTALAENLDYVLARSAAGRGSAATSEEDELLALVRRFVELTSQGPLGDEVVKEMFLDHECVQLFDSYDSYFRGCAKMRQLYLEEFQAVANCEIRLYDTTVRILPGALGAWVAGRIDSTLGLRRSGRKISFLRTRVTWVFEKHGGAWKVTHVHYSIPVGVPLRMME